MTQAMEKLGMQIIADVVFDFESGLSFEQIARRYKIKRGTIEKVIRAEMIHRDKRKKLGVWC